MARTTKTKRLVNFVEFDVVVVVVERKDLLGGMGVKVPGWNIRYHAKTETEKSIVNRIKFSVSMVLLTQAVNTKNYLEGKKLIVF